MKKIKKLQYIIFWGLVTLVTFACQPRVKNEDAKFELDHILLFVTDSSLETMLKNASLTLGEKLSTAHTYQGTKGRYFIFYNTYIELLYLQDLQVAKENEKRFKSNYTNRWDLNSNTCPFGFGLSLSPFDTSLITFPLTSYHSLDSKENEYYLMSEFNSDASSPLIYVSTPQNAYSKLDSIGQLHEMTDAEVREDFRTYLSHPIGIKKLTQLRITVPNNVIDGNMELLNTLESVEVEIGNNYAITLVFDNELQGKSISLNNTFALTIKY